MKLKDILWFVIPFVACLIAALILISVSFSGSIWVGSWEMFLNLIKDELIRRAIFNSVCIPFVIAAVLQLIEFIIFAILNRKIKKLSLFRRYILMCITGIVVFLLSAEIHAHILNGSATSGFYILGVLGISGIAVTFCIAAIIVTAFILRIVSGLAERKEV